MNMQPEQLLQQVKKVRICDTVVDQIISLVQDGSLKIGDQLPGERELVNQLQVGRASVREALRILESQGIIEVRPGKGTFITSDTPRTAGEEEVLGYFQSHAAEVLDMLEIRDALESRAAFLAAKKASASEIARMKETLEEAEASAAAADYDRVGYLDQKFHSQIATASGNKLLAELIVSVIQAMVSPRLSILHLPRRAELSLQEHHEIYDAIRKRNAEGAAAAESKHVASVRAAIISLSSGAESE
jgi:GntR family transcriptional repressor for pyruvate dehydrogenase complex